MSSGEPAASHVDAATIEATRRRAERIGDLVLLDTWFREHAAPGEVETAATSVAAGELAAVAYGQREPAGWWGDGGAAAALVAALPPLRLRDGWTLGTYAHRDMMGGHGLTFARPLGGPVSPRPLVAPSARSPDLAGSPPPVDVLRWDRDDPHAFLVASIAIRELEQLGGAWHGLWWATETILGGEGTIPGQPPHRFDDFSEEPIDFPAFEWAPELPDRWDPVVRRHADGSVTVELHTYTGRNGERVWRHVDRYGPDGGAPRRKVTAVGRGGFGYVY